MASKLLNMVAPTNAYLIGSLRLNDAVIEISIRQHSMNSDKGILNGTVENRIHKITRNPKNQQAHDQQLKDMLEERPIWRNLLHVASDDSFSTDS
ncbi:hypothetical protein M513_03542 [Trichuris suis]|uniref:Uncharacterized protein n=1 Tax=Trichuris suis TaxID=68888 RepID=A0A085ME44_9BILA|nr:hypothetical protein M513_03542 [Trichuris suis]